MKVNEVFLKEARAGVVQNAPCWNFCVLLIYPQTCCDPLVAQHTYTNSML